MGDGVNIAARLEGVAKPRAICLSKTLIAKLSRGYLAVSDLGPTKLKNIAEPVRVYSLEVSVAAPVKHAPQTEPAMTEPSPLVTRLPPWRSEWIRNEKPLGDLR
jgi:hypothetical protein